MAASDDVKIARAIAAGVTACLLALAGVCTANGLRNAEKTENRRQIEACERIGDDVLQAQCIADVSD